MQIKFLTGMLILVNILIPSILSAEEPLVWSEPVETKLAQILKIKREAMNLPSMRSEDGVLGKRSEALIREIGELITDPKLIEKLNVQEAKDIKAKIVLWSLDHKKRPDNYKKIQKYYLNRPIGGKDVIEYFRRNPQEFVADPDPFAGPDIPEYSVPRPGTWRPKLVDKEDQKEEFRLIFEYCFYMPPAGEGFDIDGSRWNLADALFAIGNPDKSMAVMSSDAEMALFAETQHEENHKKLSNSHVSLSFLAKTASEKSFAIFSEIRANSKYREKVESAFIRTWDFPLVDYQEAQKYFDAWQAMAQKERETREKQELSKWILSLDPPIKPDLPKNSAIK